MSVSPSIVPPPHSVALYVHCPFCQRKCAYCDFPSYAGREGDIPSYLECVLQEWNTVKNELFPTPYPQVTSCYFGGGTPSLLSVDQITALVQGLFPNGLPPGIEVTLEANPESLDADKLTCYRDLGINRLSVGIQSFSDPLLRRLGRLHSARRALKVLTLIRNHRWNNVSLDLMYGLPGQTPLDFQQDLDQALSFNFPHLSVYCLTLAPRTPLKDRVSRGEISLPTEETILSMMEILEEKTGNAGYRHYEVSNFAKPGYECRHNLTYWTLSPYIGLGAGAASYLLDPPPWGSHYENPKALETYATLSRKGSWPFLNRAPLTKEQALMETLLTGLRLQRGLSGEVLKARFSGETIRRLLEQARPLIESGWLTLEQGSLKTTLQGIRLLDTLILELVSPDHR